MGKAIKKLLSFILTICMMFALLSPVSGLRASAVSPPAGKTVFKKTPVTTASGDYGFSVNGQSDVTLLRKTDAVTNLKICLKNDPDIFSEDFVEWIFPYSGYQDFSGFVENGLLADGVHIGFLPATYYPDLDPDIYPIELNGTVDEFGELIPLDMSSVSVVRDPDHQLSSFFRYKYDTLIINSVAFADDAPLPDSGPYRLVLIDNRVSHSYYILFFIQWYYFDLDSWGESPPDEISRQWTDYTLTPSTRLPAATGVDYSLTLKPNADFTVAEDTVITLSVPGVDFSGVSVSGAGVLPVEGAVGSLQLKFNTETQITAAEGISLTISGAANPAAGAVTPDIAAFTSEVGNITYRMAARTFPAIVFAKEIAIGGVSCYIPLNAHGKISGGVASIYLYTTQAIKTGDTASVVLHYNDGQTQSVALQRFTYYFTGKLELSTLSGLQSIEKAVFTLNGITQEEELSLVSAPQLDILYTGSVTGASLIFTDQAGNQAYAAHFNASGSGKYSITSLEGGSYMLTLQKTQNGRTFIYYTGSVVLAPTGVTEMEMTLANLSPVSIFPRVTKGGVSTLTYTTKWYADAAGQNLLGVGDYTLLAEESVWVRAYPKDSDSVQYSPSAMVRIDGSTAYPDIDMPARETFSLTGSVVRGAWYPGEQTGQIYPYSNQAYILVTNFGAGEYAKNTTVLADANGTFTVAGGVYRDSKITISGRDMEDITIELSSLTPSGGVYDLGELTASIDKKRIYATFTESAATASGPSERRSAVTNVELTLTREDGTPVPITKEGSYIYLKDTASLTPGTNLLITVFGSFRRSYAEATITLNDNLFAEISMHLEPLGQQPFTIQNPRGELFAALLYDAEGKLCSAGAVDNVSRNASIYANGTPVPSGDYTYAFLSSEMFAQLGLREYDTLQHLRENTGADLLTEMPIVSRAGYIAQRVSVTLPAGTPPKSAVDTDTSSLHIGSDESGGTLTTSIVLERGSLALDDSAVTLYVETNQASSGGTGSNAPVFGSIYINGKLAKSAALSGSDKNYLSDTRAVYTVAIPDVSTYGGYPLRIQYQSHQTNFAEVGATAYAVFRHLPGSITPPSDAAMFRVADFYEETPAVILRAPGAVADTTFFVNGNAPGNAEVTIYLDGKAVALTNAGKGGYYNVQVSAGYLQEYSLHSMHASVTDTNGQTVLSNQTEVVYCSDLPVLQTITVQYPNGSPTVVWENGGFGDKGYYNFSSHTPMIWTMRFQNAAAEDSVENAYIHVPRSSGEVILEAVRQPDGSYKTEPFVCGNEPPLGVYGTFMPKIPEPRLTDEEALNGSFEQWMAEHTWGTAEEIAATVQALNATGFARLSAENFTSSSDANTSILGNIFDLKIGEDWFEVTLSSKGERNVTNLAETLEALPKNPQDYDQAAMDDGYFPLSGSSGHVYSRVTSPGGVMTNELRYEIPYDGGGRAVVAVAATMTKQTVVIYDTRESSITTQTMELREAGGVVLPVNPVSTNSIDRLYEMANRWGNIQYGLALMQAATETSAFADTSEHGRLYAMSFTAQSVRPSNEIVYTDTRSAAIIGQILESNNGTPDDGNAMTFEQFCGENYNTSTAWGGEDRKMQSGVAQRAVTDYFGDIGEFVKNEGKVDAYSHVKKIKKRMTQNNDDVAHMNMVKLIKMAQAYEDAGYKFNWKYVPESYRPANRRNEPKPEYKNGDGWKQIQNNYKDLTALSWDSIIQLKNQIFSSLSGMKKGNDIGKYFSEKPRPVIDPSGIVYEGAPDMPIENVTATVYYRDSNGNPVMWDAEDYGQENPVLTDESGYYEWFVPEGDWMVKYEKDEYETYWTQIGDGSGTWAENGNFWMPVAPAQLDVNINLHSLAAPEVSNMRAESGAVVLTFSKYMRTDSLTANAFQIMGESGILDFTIVPVDERTVNGEPVAKQIRLELSAPLQSDDLIDIIVSSFVQSYAGVEMSTQFEKIGLAVTANIHTVTATVGIGGVISPEGKTEYEEGVDAGYTITPYNGYAIADVRIDGDSVEIQNAYRFDDISASHTIHATFVKLKSGMTPQINIAPKINSQTAGADTISLIAGYIRPYEKTYYITGEPAPSVTLDGENTARASLANGVLTIPTGLAAGNYTVTLKAVNTEGSATMTVTVLVRQQPPPNPNNNDPGNEGCIVKFNSLGGSLIADKSVESGKEVTKPADPTRTGHAFTGWYTDAACTVKYDFSSKVTKSFTLYAGWRVISDLFTDDNGHWAEKYIDSLGALGYVNGIGNSRFNPDNDMTRAQFVQILYNIWGECDASAPAVPFTDTDSNGWYADALNWAFAKGLISGYSATTFGPDDALTREQMALLIVRSAEKFNIKLPGSSGNTVFADNGKIAEWAYDAVYILRQAGIISGKPGNIFDPKGELARGEMAKVVYMLLDFAKLVANEYKVN